MELSECGSDPVGDLAGKGLKLRILVQHPLCMTTTLKQEEFLWTRVAGIKRASFGHRMQVVLGAVGEGGIAVLDLVGAEILDGRIAALTGQIARGGYVLFDPAEAARGILLASGSELGLVMDAARALAERGCPVRVVSMPCIERFLAQDQAWREAVLPPALRARLAVEAGVPDSWWRLVGDAGDVIGMTTYGESAPAKDLFNYFGFTVDAVVERMHALLGQD